jgi:hypothetical protein
VAIQSATTRARVLITVKASPEIGRTHGETVCVAGVRLDVEPVRWMRLFPVPWDWFKGQSHPKYQVVELDVVKHESDQRPESHRPLLDTVAVMDNLGSNLKRSAVLNRLPQPSMCALVEGKGWSRTSLALVVPRQVVDFEWEDNTGNAEHRKKMLMAAQGSLLSQDAPALEFCPFSFRFRYLCQAPSCNGHRQTIVDWEISEAWRKWRQMYPTDWLERIREKWLGLGAPAKMPAFFVGNQKQAPQGFLILGITRDIKPNESQPTDLFSEDTPRPPTGGTSTDQPQNTEARLFDV